MNSKRRVIAPTLAVLLACVSIGLSAIPAAASRGGCAPGTHYACVTISGTGNYLDYIHVTVTPTPMPPVTWCGYIHIYVLTGQIYQSYITVHGCGTYGNQYAYTFQLHRSYQSGSTAGATFYTDNGYWNETGYWQTTLPV